MQLLKLTCAALVMLCITLSTHAAKLSDDTRTALFVQSGLQSQVTDFPAMIMATISQQGKFSAEQTIKVERFITTAFDPDLLIRELEGEFDKALTEQEAQEVIAWYESNSGNRIARAEEQASTAEAVRAIQTMGTELMANEALMANVQALMEKAQILESTLDTQGQLGVAVAVGMQRALDPEAAIDIERIKSLIAAQSQQVAAMVDQMLKVQLAYAYKDIDEVTMSEYLTVLDSPSMAKYIEAERQAWLTVIARASERMLNYE